MAVKHADFTLDPAYGTLAETILFETTQVEVDDQAWNATWGGYLGARRPANVQQAACIYGLKESIARGFDEPGWSAMLPDVLLSKGLFFGQDVLVGGPGAVPVVGDYYGDAPLLQPRIGI